MSDVIPISEAERLTNDIQRVSEEILELEAKRAQLMWTRNRLLAENAEQQPSKEERHYGGILISRT
jgi:hypothetical protein